MKGKGQTALIAAVGLGSGLMYVFDPVLGKTRRALIRHRANRVKRMSRRLAKSIDRTARDLANRAQGIVREVHALAARIS